MMIVKIQTSEKSNGNKGNCMALVSYLEKEDVEKENEALKNNEFPEPRKGFFSQNQQGLNKQEVIELINNNRKGLGRNDAKFYSITIAPSENEQKYLIKNITSRDIDSVKDLNKMELSKYEGLLESYTRKIMNEYAAHFKRDGLNNGKQLLYAAKVEHTREYKGTDIEVKRGLVKSGDKKSGLNTHVHLIVARKDKEMRFKLSPLAKERGKNNKSVLNGKNVQRGFDRNLFNIKSERLFDVQFSYPRSINEKVEYRIEASKNAFRLKEIELEKDKEKKTDLEKELVKAYDKRNEYTEVDKELCEENTKQLELEMNINNELEL
jgi:hypothetical protein